MPFSFFCPYPQYRGFTRQPCCMAGTMKMLCHRKNICSLGKRNLLFLSFSFFEFPIIHFVCPPNFAQTIVFKCSWGHCIFPRAFENNGLCKIWGANKVYYGEFENRECNIAAVQNLYTVINTNTGKPAARKDCFLSHTLRP